MPTAKHSQYKSVHEAVKVGDVKALEALVKDGASVNEIDDTRDRFTPMHWAAFTGALECLHWLLWHGADSSVASPKGWTPAHVAAIKGQDACIQALANNGVNLCARDGRGSSPTHLAAAHGNTFTLHSLLRAGIEVNALDKNGWSPLHSAAFHGRLGCIQLLLRWGGVIDDTDNLGNTPAHLAAMEGHLPCVKFLVGEGRNSLQILGARNNNGDTPKMLAHQFYKTKVVEYITNLEWERDHPEEAQNLSFPAHVAAYSGDLSHVRMLVENQVVNINERDDKGSTLAHKAAGQGHLDVLQWLIEMGADVKLTNEAGETPRDVARRFARLAAVRMLGPSGEADEVEADAADQPLKRRRDVRKRRSRSSRRDEEEEEEEEGEEKEEVEEETADEDGSENDPHLMVEQTKEEEKESRGRARKKMEELERLLKIATDNYVQLGGDVRREKKKEKEESELKSILLVKEEAAVNRMVAELESKLDYERNRRERLETQLDEYKLQVTRLHAALEEQQMRVDEGLERKKATKKRSSSASRDNTGGQFVRRTGYKAK